MEGPVASNSEALIAAEISRLRGASQDTKSLYREVAAALFFKFGITPTANRLYQLVGKGSMTTAAAVLTQFWNDLRERSRLQLEHPGIPDALRSGAGDLIGQIWSAAVREARSEYEPLRSELEAATGEARQTASQTSERAESLRLELARANDRISDLQSRLVERDADLARKEAEVEAAARSTTRLESDLEGARMDLDLAKSAFRDDLDSLRSTIELAEARARSAEQRAVAEIEAEKLKFEQAARARDQEFARLQEDLVVRDRALQSQREEVTAVRAVIGRLEERLEALTGQLAGERERFSLLLSRFGASPGAR